MNSHEIKLTGAELRVLAGACSTDDARVNLCRIAFTEDGRACATDGHRLVLTWLGGTRHDKAPDAKALRFLDHRDAAALCKLAKPAHEITLAWDDHETAIATVTDRKGRPVGNVTYKLSPEHWDPRPHFPPWDQVIPADVPEGGVRVAINARYMADACAALARVVDSKKLATVHCHLGDVLDPILLLLNGERSWAYVVMPVRDDIPGGVTRAKRAPDAEPAPAKPAAAPKRRRRKAPPVTPPPVVRVLGPDGAELFSGTAAEIDRVWPVAAREGSGCTMVAA